MMSENGTWQLQHAKARFSELVRCAREEGPQMVTVRGEEAVFVVAASTYRKISGPKRRLVDILLASPLRDMGLTNEEVDDLFARDRVGLDTLSEGIRW